MKISACFFYWILIGVVSLNAADLRNELIRKPGQYALSKDGSFLRIEMPHKAEWTLKASWRREDGGIASVAPDNCLKAEGWFVFVETPGRIWVFDGIDGGVLLSNTEKESGAKSLSFSKKAMLAYSQKFRDALPESIRARYEAPKR
jgi:hypothetical protein